jgi:sarcosine oxidase, subunit beta
MDFSSEFGEPLVFRRTGFLSVVPPNMAERYEREHALRLELGAPSVRLSPDEVSVVAPGVVTSDLAFGVLGADDGEISASQIMAAYERRGRELGVQYEFCQVVTGIAVQADRVVAVRTRDREWPCAHVVNAAGAGARQVGSMVGLDLPVENLRRSLYLGRCDLPEFQTGPMVEDAEMEWYYRALGQGEVLVGMGREQSNEELDGPNLDYLPEVRRAAMRRAPGLADFKLKGGSSGIRPITPDILPIIGPVEAPAGYINLCGWGGEGIMHSPAGGALAAGWILNTSLVDFDPDAFLLNRFTTTSFERGVADDHRSTG